AGNREESRYRGQHASALIGLGNVHLELGRPDLALEAHRRALEESQALVNAGSPLVAHQADLGKAAGSVGIDLAALGRLPEAVAAFRRSVKILDPLTSSHTDDPGLEADLVV